jgi:DNA-binding transcriptional regulator GbsR (MarR family)
MKKEEVQKLVNVRMELLKEFNQRQDWKQNQNAIMREIELIEILKKTINDIDSVLASHVNFS